MSKPIALSVIVPAFNEVRRIATTLDAIRAYLERGGFDYEIIVAADGNDGTRERVAAMAAENPRLTVFGSTTRGGKGRGIRLGVARARGDVIGFVDADYKTPIEEVAKLLPWFERGFDVVIGSRAIAGSEIVVRQPLHRQIGSRVFGVAMHTLVGLWGIRDTQCGFKFFRGAVARDLFGRQQIDGYMFDVEVLHLAARAGWQIKEVGVVWQDDGDSRLDLVAGNWHNMIDLFRIRFGRRQAFTHARRPGGVDVGAAELPPAESRTDRA
jgi:glycosyltransferase involved in cell wall biosynthesis